MMVVFHIGTTACMLSNIPTFYASSDEATTLFSVWQKVRMVPFSFGLGVLVVYGRLLI